MGPGFLESPDDATAEGGGLAVEMRRVPVVTALNIAESQRGAYLHAAGDKVAGLESRGHIRPLYCLKIGQTHPAAPDALVIGSPLRPLMPEAEGHRPDRLVIERQVPAAAVVAEPVSHVVPLVLVGGHRHNMLEGERIGEGALGSEPGVGQETEVAGAEPSFPREEIVIVSGEPLGGEFINKKGAVEVQVPYVVRADVYEHLRVAVVNAGVDAMVHRLVKEERHEIVWREPGVRPYDAVAYREVQPGNRPEGEEAGGDVLCVVDLAVFEAVCVGGPV